MVKIFATVLLLATLTVGCTSSSSSYREISSRPRIDGAGIAVGDALCEKVTGSVPRAYTSGGTTTPYEAGTDTFGTEAEVTTVYKKKCGAKAPGGDRVSPAQ